MEKVWINSIKKQVLFLFFSSFFSSQEAPFKRAHDEEDSGEEMEVPEKKPNVQTIIAEEQKPFSDPESDGNSSPSRKLREPRACTVIKENDGVVLKQMLNFLLKNLQKWVNKFFFFFFFIIKKNIISIFFPITPSSTSHSQLVVIKF